MVYLCKFMLSCWSWRGIVMLHCTTPVILTTQLSGRHSHHNKVRSCADVPALSCHTCLSRQRSTSAHVTLLSLEYAHFSRMHSAYVTTTWLLLIRRTQPALNAAMATPRCYREHLPFCALTGFAWGIQHCISPMSLPTAACRFHLMYDFESPETPFSLFRSRMERGKQCHPCNSQPSTTSHAAPFIVIYDNACKFHGQSEGTYVTECLSQPFVRTATNTFSATPSFTSTVFTGTHHHAVQHISHMLA
jgi:hypothetical protein